MEPVLRISDLCVGFHVRDRIVNIINHVSLHIEENEVLGLIGETGCGKSVTGSAVLRLLPDNAVVAGQIDYRGQSLLPMSEHAFSKLRGSKIVSVPQSPSTSLNPMMTVGMQVEECLTRRPDYSKKAQPFPVRERVQEIFERLKLNERGKIFRKYPCELSGGMCQRVLISMGAITNADLIVVDEPTKAVDWILRAGVVDVLRKMKEDYRCAMMMITHDIGVARALSNRIAVMYAGEIVETGTAAQVLDHPQHPYTADLISALPENGFHVTEGFMPSFEEMPAACRYQDRCAHCVEACRSVKPEMHETEPGHFVYCHRCRGE